MTHTMIGMTGTVNHERLGALQARSKHGMILQQTLLGVCAIPEACISDGLAATCLKACPSEASSLSSEYLRRGSLGFQA
jgi:hypothetical protein